MTMGETQLLSEAQEGGTKGRAPSAWGHHRVITTDTSGEAHDK